MNPQLKFIGAIREPDKYGSGEYGAPRGDHTHRGVDIAAMPGATVLSPVAGEVTKHGYPYGDDLSIHYVQITDANGYQVRLFYVYPTVEVGDTVGVGLPVGIVQSLQERYPGITNHVHVEVKTPTGDYIPWATYSRV